jgi:hypothetical protein
MSIVISATVVTDDQQQASHAAEVLARAAAGLVLDGIPVNVSMTEVDDEEQP